MTAAPATEILPVTLNGVTFEAGGERLIDRLDLTLRAGVTTVVMGPNGAGKSLTLRLVKGLIGPTAGTIFHGGSASCADTLRQIALVPQRPVLLRRSAADNLRHALAIHGVKWRERAARTEALLALGGLTALARRPARALSGGEQQRLALVRALACEPSLLLLDEPTSSLDPASTEAIERLIGAARARGTTTVLVTHDAGQARRLADEVVFLNAGRLAEQAPARSFFTAPQSSAARAYLEGRLVLPEPTENDRC